MTNDDVQAVRRWCRTDRISGLLARAVESGEVIVPDVHIDSIIDDWHQALRACVQLEALLVRVGDRLDEHHIRWAVTKGAAVAHLDYLHPAERLFADVDIVIHPDDWRQGIRLLADATPARPHTREFTRRYGKGETVLIDDMEIDLHLRFAVGYFGVRTRMRDSFDQLDCFTLAGRQIPALNPTHRFLHACFHAVLGGNPGLRALRDVAQIGVRHSDSVRTAIDVSRRWGSIAVVAAAIERTSRHLQLSSGTITTDVDLPIGRTEQRVLDVFATSSTFRRQAFTARSALSWRQQPTFLLHAARMFREHHL